MRELKFRVWDDVHPSLGKRFWYSEEDGIGISEFFQWINNHGGIKALKVQQYTGLKDKNGKEIYEGDIVEAVHFVFDFKYKDNKRPENYSGIIKWHRSYWAIGDYKLFVMEDDSLNVIGNIFENPELLK